MQAIFHFNQATAKSEKFQIGIPLSRGLYFATQTLQLTTAKHETIHARINAVQFWPDLSIKWIHVEGSLNIPLKAGESLFLTKNESIEASKRDNWVVKNNDMLCICTGNGDVFVDLKQFYALSINDRVSISADIAPINTTQHFDTMARNIKTDYEVIFDSQQKPLMCKVKQSAELVINDSYYNNSLLNIRALFSVYYADTSVFTNICVHNQNAIQHHNGQWDLGNEHSIYIDRMAINFKYKSQLQQLSTQKDQQLNSFDALHIVQCSSGGKNWNSENHVNDNMQVELSHKGAKGYVSAEHQATDFAELRPQPFVQATLNEQILSIYPHQFWQKYPTGIMSNNTSTCLDFADKSSGCQIELQPGEVKSHDFSFALGEVANKSRLLLNANIALNAENLGQSNVIPYVDVDLRHHPLMSLLNFENESATKWIEKREQLDEYGWRNFGDLYADHEAAEYNGGGIFVSHYNNQYDPLFGFLKLWLLLGNVAAKQLADDLFDHIVNIDIYHTKQDKPEYNLGLFWHTDHYVQAKTATHRTYSKYQETGVYIDHAGGGGPGAHHCYSSGLALYYLLSGDDRAKTATLGLGKWMQHIYEGDGTLLGLVLRAKNANYITLPFTNKLLLGSGTGVVRNIFTNHYPLDRGTGNYVNVLLDCFEITRQLKYIMQAEFVILNTISAQDNINKRRFHDIENTWFYIVFLQAVAKYLSIMSKELAGNEEAKQNQRTIDLVRTKGIYDAFIHYATWMAKNEHHYLANKSILEYPNDTWTGQDLRKIHVLLCAYELCADKTMLDKANQLIDIIYPTLAASKETKFTRIQVLIMQNFTCEQSIAGSFHNLQKALQEAVVLGQLSDKDKINRINKGYLARVKSFLGAYSFRTEFALLCVRVPFIKKALSK